MRPLLDDLLAAVLPAWCAGCGARGAALCGDCRARARAAPRSGALPGIAWSVSCYAYEGAVREAIARAKYRSHRAALRDFAGDLVAAVARAPARINVVTWAPASRSRLTGNGVDHAALLARAVARPLAAPVRRLLVRTGDASQTGQDAATRRRGPALRATATLHGETVLLVDDVTTTGATLAAAGRVLHGAGAGTVFAATIARTPPRGSRPAAAYTFSTIRE